MQVGEAETYLTEKGWELVTELPEVAAKAWLLESAPEARVSSDNEPASVSLHKRPWGNKVGVVVRMTPTATAAFALYNHDSKYYLMRKNLIR